MNDLYADDIVLWSERQADLLRRRAAGELVNDARLDWLNIAEEIESVGRNDKREVRSRLARLCQHLLKWAYQPDQRSSGWRGTIREQRHELHDLFDDSPSLRGFATASLARSYARGLDDARDETGQVTMPDTCPWTLEQLLNETFWP